MQLAAAVSVTLYNNLATMGKDSQGYVRPNFMEQVKRILLCYYSLLLLVFCDLSNSKEYLAAVKNGKRIVKNVYQQSVCCWFSQNWCISSGESTNMNTLRRKWKRLELRCSSRRSTRKMRFLSHMWSLRAR